MRVFRVKVGKYTSRNDKDYYKVNIPSEISESYANKTVLLYESGNGMVIALEKEELILNG